MILLLILTELINVFETSYFEFLIWSILIDKTNRNKVSLVSSIIFKRGNGVLRLKCLRSIALRKA